MIFVDKKFKTPRCFLVTQPLYGPCQPPYSTLHLHPPPPPHPQATPPSSLETRDIQRHRSSNRGALDSDSLFWLHLFWKALILNPCRTLAILFPWISYSDGVVGLSELGLCVTLAESFSLGTMPLSVRVKHRCKESITEMDLYLTYYNIYPCSNCLFWYKNKSIYWDLLKTLYWLPGMIILFALWNVYECEYSIITVNMNIFSFTFTSTARLECLCWCLTWIRWAMQSSQLRVGGHLPTAMILNENITQNN